eukprot:TRINITY_DN5390_c0_g1_i1.p1 TRINITY_DN5390_c0_g1~~TRINITY_DN5390_c0_g1_i1.p1  ORF type:complete len:376 (+),score=69.04 TRINITY_DN5390_c0_g1_i1:51-1130(+)
MSTPVLQGIADTTLQGIAIIEKDNNNDIFTTWNYPCFESPEWETVIKSRSLMTSSKLNSFSKYKDKWLYITNEESNEIPRVELFTLCLITNEFNPEKYSTLVKYLSNIYKKHKNTVKVLQAFLDVYTTTKHTSDIGTFESAPYDTPKKEHLLTSPLLDVIKMFEDRSWLIWSALIMKKRIIIYSDQLELLLKITRALPLFVLHRQDWSLLRPFVTLENPEEVEDLTKTGVYVAGFTAPQVKQREDLYDIFVDLSNLNVTVAPHAEDDFVQTQYHQDFSMFLVKALETEGINDQKLIKAVKTKTGELITKLQKLRSQNEGETEPYISFSSLRSGGVPANMENFLYAVASAEGMTKISKQQ